MKQTAALVLLAVAATSSVQAQGTPPAPTLEVPALAVSAGVGSVGRYQGLGWRAPAFFISAQVPLETFVVFEGTAAEWTWHRERHILSAQADEHWRTFSFGANVGLRAAKGPVAGTIGTGLGFQHSTLLGSACYVGCGTLPPDRQFASHDVVRISSSLQFTGSADLRIAPGVVAFGEFLMIVGNEGALGTFGGLRVPIGSRTFRRRFPELFPSVNPVRFEGGRVRLTMADGSRQKGRLLSLSLSEVVLATDATIVTVPLRDVQKLERIARSVLKGTAIGVGGGFYAGLAIGEVGSPSGEIWPVFLFSAVGAGIGAGIGIVIDAIRADRNLIYLATGAGGSIGIKPFASRRGSGLELALQW